MRSDNGSEFKNTRVDDLCDEFGIRHQFLAKYTLQSNGLVERKNRTLIDIVYTKIWEKECGNLQASKNVPIKEDRCQPIQIRL